MINERKKIKDKKHPSKGFSFIEIVVSVSIIFIFVIVALSVTTKTISVYHRAVHIAQAGFLLEEGGEAVRIFRDNSWTNISGLNAGTTYYPSFSGGTWTLSQTPNNQIGIFTRTVSVSSVSRDAGTADISANGVDDPGTKLITVNVSWVESGENTSKDLKFYISNIFQ